jgi:hypothetical protein
MAPSTPAGSVTEPRRNMAKSMAGFLEKPTILFAIFFDLGITTLSNIATKLSFSEWAAARGLYSSHELRTSSFSHGIACCSGDGDGGDDDSHSYSGGGGDDEYGDGGVDGNNSGGGGGDSNSSGGHKQQTTIN